MFVPCFLRGFLDYAIPFGQVRYSLAVLLTDAVGPTMAARIADVLALGDSRMLYCCSF